MAVTTVRPRAVHHGGPANDQRVDVDVLTQTRHYASVEARETTGWVDLHRYVFTPPQRNAAGTKDGRFRHYHYTGVHQVKGPVLGLPGSPDWSV